MKQSEYNTAILGWNNRNIMEKKRKKKNTPKHKAGLYKKWLRLVIIIIIFSTFYLSLKYFF